MKQIEVLCKQSEQVRAVAAVIRKGDKIFATQRGYGEWQDWWEFPGGKMEAGQREVVASGCESGEDSYEQNIIKIYDTGDG